MRVALVLNPHSHPRSGDHVPVLRYANPRLGAAKGLTQGHARNSEWSLVWPCRSPTSRGQDPRGPPGFGDDGSRLCEHVPPTAMIGIIRMRAREDTAEKPEA